MATRPRQMTPGWLGLQQGLPRGTRVAVMVKRSGHIVPWRLGWQQGLATLHLGGWDGNRAWPHSTRVIEVATGSVLIAPERLDGNRAWPHATREAEMPTGSDQMAPGGLWWQQGLATWHQGGYDCYRAWPHGTRVTRMATGHGHITLGRLGWHQGLNTCQGGWDGYSAWQHGTRDAKVALGSGHMAPERMEC